MISYMLVDEQAPVPIACGLLTTQHLVDLPGILLHLAQDFSALLQHPLNPQGPD